MADALIIGDGPTPGGIVVLSDGPTVPPIYDPNIPGQLSWVITASDVTFPNRTHEGGGISHTGATAVVNGNSITYAIYFNFGYRVKELFVDGVSIPVPADLKYTFSNVTTNHTITVTFVKTGSHLIFATAGEGGEISPSGYSSVVDRGSVTYTVTTYNTWRLKGFDIDGRLVRVEGSTYTFSDVDGDHSIVARFTQAPANYTVTANVGSGGSVSPSGAMTVLPNGSKSFTVTPANGYYWRWLIINGKSVPFNGRTRTYNYRNIQENSIVYFGFARNGTNTTTKTSVNSNGQTVVQKLTAPGRYKTIRTI